MATANRSRDTVDRNDPSAIFEQDQSLGNFLSDCAAAIVDNENVMVLTNTGGAEVRLTTRNDWNGFIDAFLRATTPGETDRGRAENLAATLGIDFINLIRLIDDVSASDVRREEFDATRGSQLADLLRLYDDANSYIAGVADAASAPVNGTAGADTMTVRAQSAIGSDIMDGGQLPVEGRNRQEVEAQIDFMFAAGTNGTFRDNAVNDIWHGLDLDERNRDPNTNRRMGAGLTGDFWNDQRRMRLIDAYNMPLHLEVSVVVDNSSSLDEKKRLTQRQEIISVSSQVHQR